MWWATLLHIFGCLYSFVHRISNFWAYLRSFARRRLKISVFGFLLVIGSPEHWAFSMYATDIYLLGTSTPDFGPLNICSHSHPPGTATTAIGAPGTSVPTLSSPGTSTPAPDPLEWLFLFPVPLECLLLLSAPLEHLLLLLAPLKRLLPLLALLECLLPLPAPL